MLHFKEIGMDTLHEKRLMEQVAIDLSNIMELPDGSGATVEEAKGLIKVACLQVLNKHGTVDYEKELDYDFQKIGNTLEIIPKNLFTLVVLSGRFVPPKELVGKFEYEFWDCIVGYTEDAGAYLISKTEVETINSIITVTNEEGKK
jgi:hypothetical protein